MSRMPEPLLEPPAGLPRTARARAAMAAAMLSLAPVVALTAPLPNEPCPRTESFPLPAVNGPYDYRNQRGALGVVEANHFGPQIENLVRGRTGTLAAELSFLLHGFPNHHRGLATVARYGLREKSPQPGGLDYTVECYFLRALAFRPDDHVVRMLFADYLGRIRRVDDAALQLEHVRKLMGDNPLTTYNLGLLYFELGRFKDALAMAHQAARMGVPKTDLKDRLQAKGEWAEPPGSAATEGAASGAAGARAPGS